MDKFGLIGTGIQDSKSPILFEAGYNGRHPYELLDYKDFESAWSRFVSEFRAVNVTSPFKEEAFEKVVRLTMEGKGEISGPSAKIGAANLIVKTEQGIEAHNSDFTGIILSVAEAYFPGIVKMCYKEFGDRGYIKVHQFMQQNIQSLFSLAPQALIIGCGGAGKAAAVAAAEMGFSTVLMNRTQEKAQALADRLPEYNFLTDPITDFKEAFKECDLIIYTLPTKLPEIEELDYNHFRGESKLSKKVVFEANYKSPSFSDEKLAVMQENGCQYISGKNWLLYQALTGYGLMTGEEPDFAEMIKKIL